VLTAVVTRGAHIEVDFVAAEGEEGSIDCEFPLEAGVESEEPCETGPSPIAPEVKELAWGAGSFARASARAEVAEYESALATVKAEANERVEAARQILEAERSARLGEVNAAIAAKREAAAAEAQIARDAVRGDIAAAVADVTSRTIELSSGKTPDADAVRSAVDEAMSVGVSS
jgi:F-type H+-transporting ATPase subunit b